MSVPQFAPTLKRLILRRPLAVTARSARASVRLRLRRPALAGSVAMVLLAGSLVLAGCGTTSSLTEPRVSALARPSTDAECDPARQSCEPPESAPRDTASDEKAKQQAIDACVKEGVADAACSAAAMKCLLTRDPFACVAIVPACFTAGYYSGACAELLPPPDAPPACPSDGAEGAGGAGGAGGSGGTDDIQCQDDQGETCEADSGYGDADPVCRPEDGQ